MPWYSEEFKAKVVEKMMPPHARRVADVHRETPGDRDFGTHSVCLAPGAPGPGTCRAGGYGEPGILEWPGQARGGNL